MLCSFLLKRQIHNKVNKGNKTTVTLIWKHRALSCMNWNLSTNLNCFSFEFVAYNKSSSFLLLTLTTHLGEPFICVGKTARATMNRADMTPLIMSFKKFVWLRYEKKLITLIEKGSDSVRWSCSVNSCSLRSWDLRKMFVILYTGLGSSKISLPWVLLTKT